MLEESGDDVLKDHHPMRGTLFDNDPILNQVQSENVREGGNKYNRCVEARKEETNENGLAEVEKDVGANFLIGDDW